MQQDAGAQRQFELAVAGLKARINTAAEKIMRILRRTISKPKVSKAFWDNALASIDAEYNAMVRDVYAWVKTTAPNEYADELGQIMMQVARTQGIVYSVTDAMKNLERQTGVALLSSRLASEAAADMARAVTNGQAMIKRITRLTQQKLIDEFSIDSALAKSYEAGDIREFWKILAEENPAYRKLVDTVFGNGGLLEVNGRHFDPVYYADLVARTRWHEVQSSAALDSAKMLGTDLVKVSSHNTSTPMCQEHEGKIYSISGKSDKYPKLTASPPFHPNCLHNLYPYFEEVA